MDGYIVSWNPPDGGVSYPVLLDAMKKADIPESMAPPMRLNNAFRRAAQKLQKDGIIRMVNETDSSVSFQFTREYCDGSLLSYDPEAVLEVLKTPADISDEAKLRDEIRRNIKVQGVHGSSCDALAERAVELMAAEVVHRDANDVSRLIHRHFRQHADFIPVRKAGGVFWVRPDGKPVLEKLDVFLKACGGELLVWPLNGGDTRSQQQIAEASEQWLYAQVDAAAERLAAGEDLDPEEIEALAERLSEYRSYLADRADNVAAAIEALRRDVLGAEEPEDEDVEVGFDVEVDVQAASPEPVSGSREYRLPLF